MTEEPEDGPGLPWPGSPTLPFLEALLAGLNLAHTEVRTYHHLLAHGASTPTGVARATGQSRGRIYETLEGLVRHGMATVARDRPIRYTPIPLPEVLSMALVETERRGQWLRDAYQTMSKEPERPLEEFDPGKPRPPSPPFTPPNPTMGPFAQPEGDAGRVEVRFYQSLLSARRNVRCMGPGGWSRPLARNWQATVGVFAHARTRGVSFRALTSQQHDDPKALEKFRQLWDVRATEWIPGWVVIVDDRDLFQAQPDDTGGSVLLMRHSVDAKEIRLYSELFDRIWVYAGTDASLPKPTRVPKGGHASSPPA